MLVKRGSRRDRATVPYTVYSSFPTIHTKSVIQNLSIPLFHSSFPSIHTQSLNYLVHIVLEASCARETQRRCVNYRPEVKRMGGQKSARALKRGGEGGGRRRERETCLLRNRCTAAPRAALYGSATRGEEHSRRGTTTTGGCVRARVWLRVHVGVFVTCTCPTVPCRCRLDR